MSESVSSEQHRLTILQQRISIATWLVTLILSLRGLFEFYGMKSKGDFEQSVYYMTEPIVQLFQFNFIQRLDIPGISVFFATICLLIASYTARFIIRYTEFRLHHARKVMAQHVATMTAK